MWQCGRASVRVCVCVCRYAGACECMGESDWAHGVSEYLKVTMLHAYHHELPQKWQTIRNRIGAGIRPKSTRFLLTLPLSLSSSAHSVALAGDRLSIVSFHLIHIHIYTGFRCARTTGQHCTQIITS